MQSHNTPITVWHGQPFEVPLLDVGMRWALVKYRNPREQPRTFSLMRNLYVVRTGQAFGAVGNEACNSIRVWQFRWWLGWPKSTRIELAVRKFSEKRMPKVNSRTPIPSVVASVANEIQNNLLGKENAPNIVVHIQPYTQLNIVNLNLSLHAINDEPSLKSFHDSL
jgi:hypothetical protein